MVTDPTTTQGRHPWHATVRTVFAVVVALASLVPYIIAAGNIDPEAYWVVQVAGVAGAITRIMALPQVEEFLRQFLPFLAADPKKTERSQ